MKKYFFAAALLVAATAPVHAQDTTAARALTIETGRR